MKCPLFRLANISSEFDSEWSGDDCLKEECAWWDSEGNQCMWRSLVSAIVLSQSVLMTIEEKMPHEKQFRK